MKCWANDIKTMMHRQSGKRKKYFIWAVCVEYVLACVHQKKIGQDRNAHTIKKSIRIKKPFCNKCAAIVCAPTKSSVLRPYDCVLLINTCLTQLPILHLLFNYYLSKTN